MIYAGILAGGTGSRMGADMPKQFLSIGGRPVIVHTIEKFLSCSRFDHIYVAVVGEYVQYLSDILIREFGQCDRLSVIEGGSDRNGSIVSVINAIRVADTNPDSVLVTHDGVRPFVTEEIIGRNIDAALEHGATATAIPTIDTILRSVDGNTLDEIPLRSELLNAQTPQAFRMNWFEEDYFALDDEQKKTLTDACRIFILSGRPVHIVAGSTYNIKITTPFDLTLAEAILDLSSKGGASE